MKRKSLIAFTTVIIAVSGAIYGFTYNSNTALATSETTIESCPYKGSEDCPLIEDCPYKGTDDCPYTRECCAGK